jgi:hypothetical protein
LNALAGKADDNATQELELRRLKEQSANGHFGLTMLELNSSKNLGPLTDNIWVVDGLVFETTQDLIRLFGSSLVVEQTWRLWKEVDHTDSCDGKDGLEGDGKAPDDLPYGIEHAIV